LTPLICDLNPYGRFDLDISTVREICREHGIGDATFYICKKKYAGLGLSELRELRQLREENGKLKRLVADLSLDRHILQDIVQKKLSSLASDVRSGGGPRRSLR
jgi:putative transposase